MELSFRGLPFIAFRWLFVISTACFENWQGTTRED